MRGAVRCDVVAWGAIAVVALVAGVATWDAWNQVGRQTPGFGVLENRAVPMGGSRGLASDRST